MLVRRALKPIGLPCRFLSPVQKFKAENKKSNQVFNEVPFLPCHLEQIEMGQARNQDVTYDHNFIIKQIILEFVSNWLEKL